MKKYVRVTKSWGTNESYEVPEDKFYITNVVMEDINCYAKDGYKIEFVTDSEIIMVKDLDS